VSGRAHLVLPFASSLIYVFGALWVRRAADLGVGVWRTTFIANCLSAVLFLPLAFLGGPGQPWSEFWQPVVVALLLVAGQTCGFFALTRGDVTVATPVLGMKTVVVAGLTPLLLSTGVPARLWLAAAFSTAGIALLHLAGGGRRHRWMLSVVGALAAAFFFATFDVLVQRWSPSWGAGRFVPLVMGLGAIFSFALVPLFHEPLWKIPRGAWLPLLGGSACISAQGILLITCVAVFGDSTAVNVVYSTRSLWMVLLVWWIGHWFRNDEQQLGGRVLGGRLAGAVLMAVAVMLAVI
jgi:drug/metabolite transporter (DMT)-like permease